MIRQLTKEPIKIFSRRFQCAAGYYFTKEPTLVISGDLPDGVEYYSELTDQSYAATNKDIIVYNAESTDCSTTTKRVFSNKLNDVIFSLYYFTTNRTQAFDRFDKHTMTIDYATTAVPTYSKNLKSFNIGLRKNKFGLYTVPHEGFQSKLNVVGSAGTMETSGAAPPAVITNNLITTAQSPAFQVALLKGDNIDTPTLYYDWPNATWKKFIDSATSLSSTLYTWFTYNSTTMYPPIGCLAAGGSISEENEIKGVPHSATYPSDIVFPPMTRSHYITTTSGSFTLTLPEEDLFIEVGMNVTGTGIAANTKVKSIAGKSIVLDIAANASASNTLTFSKEVNDYLFYFVGINSTSLGDGFPSASSPLKLYQYKNPTITLEAFSYSGKFGIPSGVQVQLPYDADFTPRNSKSYHLAGRKINFTATITPSGGMTDVQVVNATPLVRGLNDVEMPLVANQQQYDFSKFITLENTIGITPGMRVTSANQSLDGDYPCNLSGGTTSTTTFTTTNTNLVEVGSVVESATPGQVLPSASKVQSRSIIGGPLQQIVIDKPLDNSIFDKTNMPVELIFTTATSITAFEENARVVSVDSYTRITVDKPVNLTINDTLTFTSDNLNASTVSLTAVEDGANAIISGYVTLDKGSKLDTSLYIDLDNILTES